MERGAKHKTHKIRRKKYHEPPGFGSWQKHSTVTPENDYLCGWKLEFVSSVTAEAYPDRTHFWEDAPGRQRRGGIPLLLGQEASNIFFPLDHVCEC